MLILFVFVSIADPAHSPDHSHCVTTVTRYDPLLPYTMDIQPVVATWCGTLLSRNAMSYRLPGSSGNNGVHRVQQCVTIYGTSFDNNGLCGKSRAFPEIKNTLLPWYIAYCCHTMHPIVAMRGNPLLPWYMTRCYHAMQHIVATWCGILL